MTSFWRYAAAAVYMLCSDEQEVNGRFMNACLHCACNVMFTKHIAVLLLQSCTACTDTWTSSAEWPVTKTITVLYSSFTPEPAKLIQHD